MYYYIIKISLQIILFTKLKNKYNFIKTIKQYCKSNCSARVNNEGYNNFYFIIENINRIHIKVLLLHEITCGLSLK